VTVLVVEVKDQIGMNGIFKDVSASVSRSDSSSKIGSS